MIFSFQKKRSLAGLLFFLGEIPICKSPSYFPWRKSEAQACAQADSCLHNTVSLQLKISKRTNLYNCLLGYGWSVVLPKPKRYVSLYPLYKQ